MNGYKIVLCVIPLSLIASILLCQDRQIFFENLREKEGLPYHLVTDVDQDSLGRLWVSTYNGLYLYDGYEFRGFQHSPTDSNTISSNLIRTAKVDHAQRVWIGTEKDGLNLLDPAFNQVIRFPSTLFQNGIENVNIKVDHLAEDGQQHMWAAVSDELFRFKLENDSLHFVEIPNLPLKFNTAHITVIFPDQKGNVWIATNQGLLVFNTTLEKWSDFKGEEDDSILLNKKISDVIEDDEGGIWVGVRDETGIYKIDPSNFTITPYHGVGNFRTANRVHLCFDNMNHLWVVAGRSGVYRHDLDTKENQFFEGKDYEQDIGNFTNFTHSPLLDKFGNVWFCGGGLHKWSNTFKDFTHYRHPFGNYQTTAAIYDDSHYRISSLWGKGVVVWNKEKKAFYELNTSSGLFSDRVYAFVPYQGDTYLLGGEGGYQFVNLRTRIIGNHIELSSTIYHGINIDGQIYIGGNEGIFKVGGGSVDHILSNLNLRYFKMLNDNEFWIPSLTKGLFKWDRSTDSLRQYRYIEGVKNSLRSNRVEHLDVSENGIVWLATGAGITSFEPATSRWKHYDEDHHIAGVRANAIHCIDDTSIWISNNQGIALLNVNDKKWTHFRTEDGLLNTYFYERSSFLNEDGRLFFGGRLGIVHFLPNDLKVNPIPPSLYFDEIKVDGNILLSTIPNRKSIVLPWNHKYFEINFTGTQLTEPLSVTYQYRLLPLNEVWTTIKKQPLFFNGIKPGIYNLEIKAYNGDGVPTSSTLKMEIKVETPFWKTYSFYGLIACLLGVFLFWYIKRTQLKYQKQLDLERKLNEVELSALRSQMSPHFIFNTLSSIQHFIIEGDEEKALKYLSTFSRIIRKVLEYSNRSFIPFEEEVALLKDYVNLEQLRFGQTIDFVINVSEALAYDLPNLPPMLIQPIIENAINHGLRPLDNRNKKLTINFDKVDHKTLAVQVVDNGIGRKAATKLKDENHESTGTLIVKNRLQIVGEQMDVQTLFEIVDLNDNGSPTGTLVNMQIPFQRSNV